MDPANILEVGQKRTRIVKIPVRPDQPDVCPTHQLAGAGGLACQEKKTQMFSFGILSANTRVRKKMKTPSQHDNIIIILWLQVQRETLSIDQRPLLHLLLVTKRMRETVKVKSKVTLEIRRGSNVMQRYTQFFCYV